MTESTSERSPRAASVSSRSRYARLAVRGLVVAGLAGVAWLLSSSAAHASKGDAPKAAKTASTADRGLLGDLLGGVLPGATTKETGPVLHPVVEPVGTVLDQVHSTVGEVVKANATGAAVAASPVAPVSRSRSTGATVSSGSTRTTATLDVAERAANAGPDGTATDGTVQRGAGARTDLRRTSHVPLLPRPAPAPAVPGGGLTSGVPGTGSGPNQDGGAPAIAPARPVVSALATTGRPETVDDVAVRPLVAESPTVSPD